MKKILILLTVIGALGITATFISHFARRGELKVHLRDEIMAVRKKDFIKPLKPDRQLASVCRAHAKLMEKTGSLSTELGRLTTKEKIEAASGRVEDFYMEIGLMPKGKNYQKASQAFLAAARNPAFTRAGFGQHIHEQKGTFYCYLVATPGPTLAESK